MYLIRQTNDEKVFEIIDDDYIELYKEQEYPWIPIPEELIGSVTKDNIEFHDNHFHINEDKIIEVKSFNIQKYKDFLLDLLNTKIDSYGKELKQKYSDVEKENFQLLKTQAKNYLNGINDFSILEIMSKTENMSISILAQKIIQKSEKYENNLGIILGTKNSLKDRIKRTDKEEDLYKLKDIIVNIQIKINE